MREHSSVSVKPVAKKKRCSTLCGNALQVGSIHPHLSQAADQWATIKQSQGDVAGFHSSFISGLDRAWGDFGRRLNSEAEWLTSYANSWEREHTIKKVASRSDFSLAWLCFYVKSSTGRPHHKELTYLLEGAWAGHGQCKHWSINMLKMRLRRVHTVTETLEQAFRLD